MSDDKAQQEPSMEDILASIRRILSEDDAEEAVKAAQQAAPTKPAPAKAAPPPPPPPPPPPAQPAWAAEAEFEPEPEPEPNVQHEPEVEEDILDLTDDMVAEDEFEESADLTGLANLAEEEPRPLRFESEPLEEMVEEELFGQEESLLARPVQAASTSSLSELARVVARERGIGLGNGGVTLEDLVREILKNLIKDWLDQNLPYMIERIVKKEIERMVNRAEKL